MATQKRVASPAQRSALKAGQAKRDANRAARKKAKETGELQTASERWAMLLDGSLTVEDLSNEELVRKQLANSHGEFLGGRSRAVPSHLITKMDAELAKRVRTNLQSRAMRAEEILYNLMEDEDVPGQTRAKIALDYIERIVGKVPDQVHVKVDDWGGIVGDAVAVERDVSDIEAYANEG